MVARSLYQTYREFSGYGICSRVRPEAKSLSRGTPWNVYSLVNSPRDEKHNDQQKDVGTYSYKIALLVFLATIHWPQPALLYQVLKVGTGMWMLHPLGLAFALQSQSMTVNRDDPGL